MSNLNHANRCEDATRARVQNAIMRIIFVLTMCLQQYLAGGLFESEHLADVSSCGTMMMREISCKERMYFKCSIFVSLTSRLHGSYAKASSVNKKRK